eukprot:3666437-Ditylum_brightwellii.AAC.1
MLAFINRLPKEDEVLLAMDANGEIGDEKLGKFLTSTRLLDVIGSKHRTNSPPTYICGKTTINYIFATPGILEAVRKCGITAFHQIIKSDHTSIYVDLSVTQLFAGLLHDLHKRESRRVGTKDTDRSDIFRERATKKLPVDKISKLITDIDTEMAETGILNKEKYKAVDRKIHNALMDASTSLTPVPKVWWLPKIGHALRVLQYWKTTQSFEEIGLTEQRSWRNLENKYH